MASHVDLLTELQLLEKVPTLERLRAAQKRRAQQLKKWAQYEQDLQHRKRKHERKRSSGGRRKKVTFEASVALLEASLRNDAEEGRPLCSLLAGGALVFLPPAGVWPQILCIEVRAGGGVWPPRVWRPHTSGEGSECILGFLGGDQNPRLWLMNIIIILLPCHKYSLLLELLL